MLKNIVQINRLFESNKPLIIYKTPAGFDVFTDFSEKIKLNNSNLNDFFKKIEIQKKRTNRYFDGYIGFFGYEILCNLIGVKIPKQKTYNFPSCAEAKPGFIKGVFGIKVGFANLIVCAQNCATGHTV